VGIKDLDPEDHEINSGLRDTFIPPMLGIKTFGSRSCGLRVILIRELGALKDKTHKIMGSKVACATL
jgi:hypothetical protein